MSEDGEEKCMPVSTRMSVSVASGSTFLFHLHSCCICIYFCFGLISIMYAQGYS